jgi:hypothetical protein
VRTLVGENPTRVDANVRPPEMRVWREMEPPMKLPCIRETEVTGGAQGMRRQGRSARRAGAALLDPRTCLDAWEFTRAFAKWQELLTPEQYELVDVWTSQGRAILPTMTISSCADAERVRSPRRSAANCCSTTIVLENNIARDMWRCQH